MKKEKETIEIGKVAALYRYPVKSMRGQSLEAVEVGWHGFLGDRRYAFVKTGNKSRFPWLTAREIPTLIRYVPNFADPADPTASVIMVQTPEGHEIEIEDEALLTEVQALYGKAAHLVQSNRGNFDSLTVSMITTATLETLGQHLDSQFEGRQFRQNIVIENLDGEPFAEESWLGSALVFGEGEEAVRLRANKRIKRCMMVNLDPDTGQQNPAILREIVQTRELCLGIFGTPQQIGQVRVGDKVQLVRG